jgi:hypothetical protein
MDAAAAIADAKNILSLPPVEEGNDPRWQAIIAVGEFIDSDPEEVWQFILDAADITDHDLQQALATCLLEHLIEKHPAYKQRAADYSARDEGISEMLSLCWYT